MMFWKVFSEIKMANCLVKPMAFFLKDLLNESSYRLSFLLQVGGIFFTVVSLFFLSKLFQDLESIHLKPYGGSYFSFVIIGVALGGYLEVSLRSFSSVIRDAQVLGTLEALILTQTNVSTIILSSSIYSFVFTSFRIVVFLLFGILLFGLNIRNTNITAVCLIICLTIVCFSSIGIISASFIMIFKKGDPFNWLFTSLSWLLGGIYYPMEVLPNWAQKLAQFLPITHALKGMRLAILKGNSLIALLPHIIPLTIITMVLLPVSLQIFRFALKKAKINGSLIQY